MQSLDKEESREYYQAMEFVPGLVARETPIHLYLRSENNDTKEAAKRLARYWKYRKEFFFDRWLLPMIATGSGTLNPLESQVALAGFTLILPRKNTGPVILVDYAQIANVIQASRAQRIDTVVLIERVSMYVATVYMEVLAQGPSTLIHPITSKSRPLNEIFKRVWDMFNTALPAKLNETVVTQAHEEGRGELFDYLRFSTSRCVTLGTGIQPKELFTNSTMGTIALLESNGIPRSVLPLSIGGTLDYDAKVAEWVRARLYIDSFVAGPNVLSPSTAAAAAPLPANVMTTFGKPVGKTRSSALAKRKPETGQSEEQFLRERNRMYVRRYAQKQKLEVISLTDQKDQLELQRGMLQQQNEQLERALSSALQLVGMYLTQQQSFGGSNFSY